MKPHTLSLIRVPLLIGLAFLQPAQAVNPPPDGGYPRFNTAEGQDALFSLKDGAANTAIGYHALYFNATGDSNTAIGLDGLPHNTSGRSNTATGAHALDNNMIGMARRSEFARLITILTAETQPSVSPRFITIPKALIT